MKLPKSVGKLLENKLVLYFVLFLAVTNIYGYMVVENTNAIVIFIVLGLVASRFSKNMIIILGAPLIFTSFFVVGNAVKEGMENASSHVNDTPKQDQQQPVQKPKEIHTDEIHKTNPPNPHAAKPKDKSHTKDVAGEEPQKDNMTTMYKKNNRIDYAATVEDAYDDLNKILGGDGIKRLTDDTQKLITQQTQLADAMKSMSPLLDQAKTLMSGFDMKNFEGIASMAKQFGVGN